MFSGDKDSEIKMMNDYLARLESALIEISAGDRADIVIEMRGNILKAKEKSPQMSWQSIFDGLGEPEQVANHYLLGRGLALKNPPKHSSSAFKWIVIGFLGTLGLLTALIVIMTFIFTPLVKIDESTGRVQFFGGAFDIQAKNVITQLSKEGSFVFGSISGVENLGPEVKLVEIIVGTGELRIDYNDTSEMNWDCDGAGKSARTQFIEKQGKLQLDFSAALVDCDISIPNKDIKVSAISGDIDIKAPKNNVYVKVDRGNVSFSPEPTVTYTYTLKASEPPLKEDFPSSDDKDAILISIEVIDGEISKLD